MQWPVLQMRPKVFRIMKTKAKWEEIQNDLSKYGDYTELWQMKFNVNKYHKFGTLKKPNSMVGIIRKGTGNKIVVPLYKYMIQPHSDATCSSGCCLSEKIL